MIETLAKLVAATPLYLLPDFSEGRGDGYEDGYGEGPGEGWGDGGDVGDGGGDGALLPYQHLQDDNEYYECGAGTFYCGGENGDGSSVWMNRHSC